MKPILVLGCAGFSQKLQLCKARCIFTQHHIQHNALRCCRIADLHAALLRKGITHCKYHPKVLFCANSCNPCRHILKMSFGIRAKPVALWILGSDEVLKAPCLIRGSLAAVLQQGFSTFIELLARPTWGHCSERRVRRIAVPRPTKVPFLGILHGPA